MIVIKDETRIERVRASWPSKGQAPKNAGQQYIPLVGHRPRGCTSLSR